MGRLDGKVAIITGGNSGIGRATAELFCREGANVIIAGRREVKNQHVVEELSDAGGSISAVNADVAKMTDCKKIVESTIEKYGHIDILVNNAGISDRHMPINECDEDWFDTVCKIDQYSVFYMSKYALVHMEQQRHGSIINVSSIGSLGIAGIAYSAAKAAVNSMTKNIALLYAKYDIRCNAVAPGPTPTELNTPEQFEKFHQGFAEECAKHIDITLPQASDNDQAEAILFFASDLSKAITGQVLYVDHGTSL